MGKPGGVYMCICACVYMCMCVCVYVCMCCEVGGWRLEMVGVRCGSGWGMGGMGGGFDSQQVK
jgi:hypothetical protein